MHEQGTTFWGWIAILGLPAILGWILLPTLALAVLLKLVLRRPLTGWPAYLVAAIPGGGGLVLTGWVIAQVHASYTQTGIGHPSTDYQAFFEITVTALSPTVIGMGVSYLLMLVFFHPGRLQALRAGDETPPVTGGDAGAPR